MGKRYQVVGAVAVLTQHDPVTGPSKRHLYKGAVVGPGATETELAHNLSVGLIAEIPSDEPAGLDAAGEPVVGDRRTVGTGEPGEFFDPLNPAGQTASTAPEEDFTLTQAEQAEEAAAKADDAEAAEVAREAARAKLPEDGSAPDGRAGKDVWVEHAVRKGYDRAQIEATDKKDIVGLFRQQ